MQVPRSEHTSNRSTATPQISIALVIRVVVSGVPRSARLLTGLVGLW